MPADMDRISFNEICFACLKDLYIYRIIVFHMHEDQSYRSRIVKRLESSSWKEYVSKIPFLRDAYLTLRRTVANRNLVDAIVADAEREGLHI